jgi:aspartyl-tRNA(Asn)/glutamyl-tRNA(Gln) amidotransferase subunit A
MSKDKMPIGLQIIGKPFDEAAVLKVADAYERHTRWHLEYPPISN